MRTNKTLVSCRIKIDYIDKRIIWLIARRFALAKKIGIIKRNTKIKVLNKSREKEVLAKVNNLAKKLDMNEIFAEKIYKLIINESKKQQHAPPS